jgi:hypothetical protein
LGERRYLAAVRLGWSAVGATIGEGLDDRAVLQLAWDEDRSTEKRTHLERAWFYASMCAAGLTQAALAKRENISAAAASMYVRAGTAITPARIAEANLRPEELAAWGITKLLAVASGPEHEIAARIAAAGMPPTPTNTQEPCFEWHHGRSGITRATFRQMAEMASWSKAERVELISRLGPLIAEARIIEGIVDPAVSEALAHAEAAHRAELINIRELSNNEISRQLQLNATLLALLSTKRAGKLDSSHEATGFSAVMQSLQLRFEQVLRWRRKPSMIKDGASTVDDLAADSDTQIRFRFDSGKAA